MMSFESLKLLLIGMNVDVINQLHSDTKLVNIRTVETIEYIFKPA